MRHVNINNVSRAATIAYTLLTGAGTARGTRDDMAAMAAGGTTPPGPPAQDHTVTLMEDPDVWRPN